MSMTLGQVFGRFQDRFELYDRGRGLLSHLRMSVAMSLTPEGTTMLHLYVNSTEPIYEPGRWTEATIEGTDTDMFPMEKWVDEAVDSLWKGWFNQFGRPLLEKKQDE